MNEIATSKADGTLDHRPLVVVGIGTAAGGAGALEAFFRNLPEDSGLAFVVLADTGSPAETNRLREQLTTATPMDVVPIADGVSLESNRVYLGTDAPSALVRDGRLRADRDSETVTPVDRLFYSLSSELSERAVGIVLSGAGTDGTLGLKAIGDAGGMTMAQSPESAIFEAMPRNAATVGVADHVLDPEAMSAELLRYSENLVAVSGAALQRAVKEDIESAIRDIADVLSESSSHDFRHYKIPTMVRRVGRRMRVLGLASVEAYLSRLRDDRGEARALFRDLLIGVTAFFRDPSAFDALATEVIPALFEKRSLDEPIRIWVSGCASGEEAYSIAMLVREEMERRERTPEVQIFATDIDDLALEIARKGLYPAGIAEDVSPERLERFFVKRGRRFQIERSVRELCRFSHHNLISDAPFSRQDLISCRNLLIYLGAHLQRKLVSVFHYALRPGGFLFLGPSESIGAPEELFGAVDAASHISQRRPATTRATTVIERTEPARRAGPLSRDMTEPADVVPVIQSLLLDEFSPRAVVVDDKGRIVCTSGDTSKYLKLDEAPFANGVLELVQTGLRVGLRRALAEAIETKRRVVHDKLSVRVRGKIQPVRITVQPMPRLGVGSELYLVVLEDIGVPIGRRRAKREPRGKDATLIAQLEDELQNTREGLEKSLQDLESTNEVLKTSNRELLSINEELQSANEELETRKEEVQVGHDALERANSDLENVLLVTEIAVIILDDELCIRSFTPAVTRIYNLIDSDVGRPLWHQTHRALDMPPVPDAAELAASGEQMVENVIRTMDGRWFVRRVRPYRTRDRRNDGLIVTFTDVTDLTESEKRRRVLTEHVPDIVFHANKSLEWTYVNPRFAEWTGTPAADILREEWVDCLHPEDVERTREALARARQTGEALQVEHRLRLRDETYRWFVTRAILLDSGDQHAPEWFGSMTDVHELKQTQEALQRSEQQRRLALSAARLGVYELDFDTHTVTLDERGREILAVENDSVSVDQGLARVHPDDRTAVEEVLGSTSPQAGDGRAWIEFRVEVRDREEMWVAANTQAQFGQTAWGLKPVRLIGTLQDITERKRVEQEWRAARVAAESASVAKSQFLANMSHEIRTPMTAVLGYTDILAKRLSEDDEALEFVETIRRNGRFLLEILNDVLDLSKIEAAQLEVRTERFRPDRVVAEVRSLMEAQAQEKGIDLVVGFDGELPETITSDPQRLRQILLNLVSNAVKFTERGSVRLVTRLRPENEELEFLVVDTGVGISPEQQQSLFDPFAQGDASPSRRFMGTGLGLTISQRLAHLLGGSIRVESEVGKGSTFRLTVGTGSLSGRTLITPEEEIVSTHEGRRAVSVTLDGSVLVVDDRREVRALAKHFLEEAGASVTTASDGREAIDQVKRASRSGEPFDVVVMDIQMPGMDGYDAVSRLRAEGFEHPIIALTAHAMRGEREACLAAGCDDYASKPIESDELVAMIARHLDRTAKARRRKPSDSDGAERGGDRRNRFRILLVDDSPDLLTAKRILLESRGHDLRTAGSGAAALDAASAFDAEVVILDLGLPDMTGYDLLARLKDVGSLKDAVFLALSGRDEDDDRRRSLEAGFHAHLVKPADIDEIEDAAARILGATRR